VWLLLILTSALDGMNGSVTPWPGFALGERRAGTHFIGGWVDLTAGLHTVASIASVADRNPVIESVARYYID
jgi:hypothetical protein